MGKRYYMIVWVFWKNSIRRRSRQILLIYTA